MKKSILVFSLCATFLGCTNVLYCENSLNTDPSVLVHEVNSNDSKLAVNECSKRLRRRQRRRGGAGKCLSFGLVERVAIGGVCFTLALVTGAYAGAGVMMLFL